MYNVWIMSKNQTRITITLTNDAIDLLDKFTTPRKRGDFIDKLIKGHEYDEAANAGVDLDNMRFQMTGMSSLIKAQDARLLVVERNLAKVINDNY